jgi:hypothetical protein
VVRHFLERRRRALERRDEARRPTPHEARSGQWGDVQFVPARWLVLALSVVEALFGRGRMTKVGIASLVWSFTPRSLKIVAAGFALAATVVFVGAIAAIALLALQLT